ncbi:alginate lyase family protein [Glycomyces albus]
MDLPTGSDVTTAVATKLRELGGREPERPEQPTAEYWKWYNLATARHREENTFAFYRILGNDLPPRHRSGQTYENLKFILENEPDYLDCRKFWVLNRIIDEKEKARLVDLLKQHGAEYIDIPVDWDEYRKIGWNFNGLIDEYPSYGQDFDKKYQPNAGHRYREHIYHDKNLYLINNNGARNAALRHGRALAKWVLPWDGNCFMTERAWDLLRNYVASNSHLRYIAVPMARLTESNEVLLDPEFTMKPTDEPQVLFRSDTDIEFNPDFRYGHRPKVELFRRLQIPGNWDNWPTYSWDPEIVVETGELNAWGKASWVARLYSGSPELELASATGLRGQSRSAGIRALIDQCDVKMIEKDFDAHRLFSLDDDRLEAQVRHYRASGGGALAEIINALVASAKERLNGRIYSPLDKTTTAPSKDPKDYWNPAPYWWPNPDSPDGLPYVRRDGHRVPGTILGAPGSEKYDRTSVQCMVDETFVNALAHEFTGEIDFAEKAAAQIRAWFIDPSQRMNPHLRFAQVRLGHNHNVGYGRGILETKDFYYLLDAIRLVERSGRLTGSESAELREWFGRFREWLDQSPQGRSERAAENNHGTWYDVQLAAIDGFIGNSAGLQETFRRVFERVGHQFSAEDGAQTEELKRTLTQHYCAYNFSGWLVLNDQADRIGGSLWDFKFPGGVGLREAMDWISSHADKPWMFEQIEEFDADRFQAIGHWAAAAGLSDAAAAWLKPLKEVKPVFSVHHGIRPYWMVANRCVRLETNY